MQKEKRLEQSNIEIMSSNFIKKKDHKLVFFGASSALEKKWSQLKKLNIIPDFICDNDKNKHGKYFKKHKIYSPDEILCNLDKCNVLITSSYVNEIKEQLEKYNNIINVHNIFTLLIQIENMSNNIKENFIDYCDHKLLNTKLKLIALYVPQFYPFLENDKWWGKGFTEWTNVTKATPNFLGHYQPHLPIHNGFYDLRIPEVMIEQAKLARNYGIYGFNFYYYWFDGKILMHKPFEILLQHKEIDINFCITWANENLIRKNFNGQDELLIAQNYDRDNCIKFINSLLKFFNDERYIRINNKPLLIINQPNLIPDITEIAKSWREEIKKYGFDGLYLICAQTNETYNPNAIGFDAAIEFPFFKMHIKKPSEKFDITNPFYRGTIFDYDIEVKKVLKKQDSIFKVFKTIMLPMDNTPQMQNNATIFHNFSLETYKNWATNLFEKHIKDTKYNDEEKLVFINAWNDWGKGMHLEPDREYGYGYLQATYEALLNCDKGNNKIIVVSHDAYPNGAQFLALNIVKYLSEHCGYEIEVILCGEGDLFKEFKKICPVHNIYFLNQLERKKLFLMLYKKGFKKAIANTSVVGDIVEGLSDSNIYVITLIHEMRETIKKMNLFSSLKKINQKSNLIVFPNLTAMNDIKPIFNFNNKNIKIIPQGIFRKNQYKFNKLEAKQKLYYELNLPLESTIILNIAHGNYRKGIDIFTKIASKIIEKNNTIHFVWVGDFDSILMKEIKKKFINSSNKNNIHFVGQKFNIDHYYAGSDLFFLTSREDPFPSVVLDAMNCALPVIAFKDCGGFEEIIENKDLLLDINNIDHAVQFLISFIKNNDFKTIGSKNQKLIDLKFSFKNYIYKLIELLGNDIKKVSVVIPNYNHEKYIRERLESILNQSYPIYEIIFLDDNSNDSSLDLAKHILANSNIDFKIIKNETNSGSVFKQWAKGINLSQGDFIWIAESDDSCKSNFLKEIIDSFDNKNIGISYCQSKIIDENSNVKYKDTLFHTDSINKEKWKNKYIKKGATEIREALIHKNTIPNVSACVFRKDVFKKINLDSLNKFRFCGDWYLYILILEQFDISFSEKPLNNFRKHSENVTTINSNKIEYIDETIMIKEYLHNNFFFTDNENDRINKDFIKTFIENNINKNQILEKYIHKLKEFSISKSKHITIVTFNKEFGGSEVLWYELSQILSLKGYKINVFCLKDLLNSKKQETLSICKINLNEVSNINKNIFENIISDLVIFSIGDHNDGGQLFDYCVKNSIKYIIINQLVKETMWVKDNIFLKILFDGYKNAEKTFFTSKNNIDIFESKMGEKLQNAVIHYNPIDRGSYVEYPNIKDTYYIAFPARLLTIHKGQDLLLEVLSQSKWKKRNLVVNFYGVGTDEQKLKQIVKEKNIKNVNFLGQVEDMKEIWGKNHAFILTSRMEGLPIVLLSAMFAGRVPIVTNVGGNSEIIIDGENGFISNDFSIESIDKTLERAWNKKSEWKDLGKKGKDYIDRIYPVNQLNMINQINNILKIVN